MDDASTSTLTTESATPVRPAGRRSTGCRCTTRSTAQVGRRCCCCTAGCSTSTCSSVRCCPALSQSRQVIAADFQAHGRTNDIDRPLTSADLASDVVGLLEHLGLSQVDVFGFSVGGAVALRLAIKHPELVRKADRLVGVVPPRR